MELFRHEIISDRIIRIINFLGNCCYLVIGEEKACLLDTLDGFGNLEEYARKFTDKPIFVILTHAHLDHCGGCFFFEEVYMNHKDLDLFNTMSPVDYRLNANRGNPEVAKLPISELNPSFEGHIINVDDGDVFDLGNVSIKMIAVKGHTQGTMIPLIVEERAAVFGDACGVGTLILEYSATIEEYRKSLINFKQHEDSYDLILRNHGTFTSPKELLDNVIECCDIILEGNREFDKVSSHGHDFLVTMPMDDKGNRVDGKQGNIKFLADKIR